MASWKGARLRWDNDSSFLFYLLQQSYYLETTCDAPLNYSTTIINSAQVAFLARSSPEGLHKTRSAPDLGFRNPLWNPILETRDPQLRNIFGTRTRWHHLFGSFPFLFVCARFVSFYFLLPKWGLHAGFKPALTSWWMASGSETGHFSSFILAFFSLLKLISHFSPATWAEWHHLRIYIF